jgi:hypothetical protein
MKSATDRQLESLHRQLAEEKRKHAQTRQELQRVITRQQAIIPPRLRDLMGQYPALRRLLAVLVEASDLSDPSKGAPMSDVMRVGHGTSSTERAVEDFRKARAAVRHLDREMAGFSRRWKKKLDAELEDRTYSWASLVGASEWEYEEG